MTQAHTPGPWVVRATASGNPFVYEAATGKTIAGKHVVIFAEYNRQGLRKVFVAPGVFIDDEAKAQLEGEET